MELVAGRLRERTLRVGPDLALDLEAAQQAEAAARNRGARNVEVDGDTATAEEVNRAGRVCEAGELGEHVALLAGRDRRQLVPQILGERHAPIYNRAVSAPGIFRLPPPTNEPVREYAPGSPERAELKAKLDELESQRMDLPLVIGGEEIRTGETTEVVMPHRTSHVLADMHQGGPAEVDKAIKAAGEAWHDWSR